MSALHPEVIASLDGLRSAIESFKGAAKADLAKMQRQLDAVDLRSHGSYSSGAGSGESNLARELFDSSEFKSFAEVGGKGRMAIRIPDFQKKTAVTGATLGAYSTGVVFGERLPGIVPAATATFRIRDLIRKIPTESGLIDFVKVTAYSKASPQSGENVAKAEANLSFESVSEKMATIAHWLPVSKQAIQDLSALAESVNVHLLAGLFDEEDRQLLEGDGTTDVLHGFNHQAEDFDTTLTTSSDGWEYSDLVGLAIGQLEASKHQATGVILHPTDFWKIALCKDGQGRYIHGDPATMRSTYLWGRPVAVTCAQTVGQFTVGDFVSGCALHQRQDAVIDVSDSHDDYFVKNMLAVRCEMREALAIYKPQSFCHGSFSQSPI